MMVWKKKREEDDRKNKGKEHCGYGDAHLIKKQGGIEKKNDYSSRKKGIYFNGGTPVIAVVRRWF